MKSSFSSFFVWSCAQVNMLFTILTIGVEGKPMCAKDGCECRLSCEVGSDCQSP